MSFLLVIKEDKLVLVTNGVNLFFNYLILTFV